MNTRVKICCLSSLEDALIAIDAGADAIGFVSRTLNSPRSLSDDVIRAICNNVPKTISTFVLTSEMRADRIAAHLAVTQATTVQISSHIDPTESERLSIIMPDITRVQSIHVEDKSALNLIDIYSPFVDAFLLDSGRPTATTPEFGGTGRTHDWDISKAFVEASPIPVYLAGGLNSDNVAEAIAFVKPHGVDLCSGVRTNGKLDLGKLHRFIKSVKG